MGPLRGLFKVSVRRFSFSSTNRPVKDSLGRSHDYLRVSLTERCNLRCRYCMPEDGITLTDVKNTLSLDEIKHLTRLFVETCGVKKIRLTGGEPTIDRKLGPILEHLTEMRDFGLQTIAMTTNGLTLKARASSYRDLGE
jgi:molybdenum cofactor biosynthesis enzyme MoaA